MGFDPRRWRPSSGSRPLTTNVEALLAENEALRREVRALRLQLELFHQGSGGAAEPGASAADPGATREQPDQARARRHRVTVSSSHGLSPELVARWGASMARHPRWQELRIGSPGGLRELEQELRQRWWNPRLTLEQELDRRSPGLGAELAEALRGPHSRARWAVRVSFALYGPRAGEWLNEAPLRVVEELLRRQQRGTAGHGQAHRKRGTRTANTSGSEQTGAAGQGSRAERHTAGEHRQARARSERRSGPSGRRPPERSDPRAAALALLGLEPGATLAAIKKAYRRLAKAHHPDLGGDVESFRRLDAAYRSLI